jgi:hypothetical protein
MVFVKGKYKIRRRAFYVIKMYISKKKYWSANPPLSMGRLRQIGPVGLNLALNEGQALKKRGTEK